MCGIVGYSGDRQAGPALIEALKKLEYRGYDSAGIATAPHGKINMVKALGAIKNLCARVDDGRAVEGTSGIAHTRWATHGAPSDINAHPHLSADGKFALIHNGIIENYSELRDELISNGVKFVSETDTEVAAHLISSYYKGDVRQALMKAASRLKGSYALGVICAEHPDKIYACREQSPLIIGLGAGENYFASDITAFVAHTRSVVYMEDGEFAELSADGVSIFDISGRELDKPAARVTWDVEAAEKGGYEHFMMKEIMEQPRAVKSTIDAHMNGDEIALGIAPINTQNIRDVVITACGSAYHAGCVGRFAIEDLCGMPVRVEYSSELRYRSASISADTLVIAISQSGETFDTLAAMRECKSRGARVLAIVNVVGSAVAKLADDVIYTHAGPEIAVATTKGYTTQLSALYLLAVEIARGMGKLAADDCARYISAIRALPSLLQRAIDLNPHIPYLAERYRSNTSAFFIGRGIDCAVCLEASLKLKEISYIHSEAYAAGELKHGTIALIEPGRLVVAMNCCSALSAKLMSNIKEVKARGAKALGVTREGNSDIFSETDDAIFVPLTEELFMPVIAIVPLQIFAYHIAKLNGCDIDKPRNLAKSVTVE